MSRRRQSPLNALGDALAPLGASAFLALSPVAGGIAAVSPSAALAQAAVVPVAPKAGGGTASGPARPAGQGDKPATARERESRNPAEVTALVLADGEQRGSAVIVRQGLGGTWLVTNRHVVDGEANVCVRTADGTLRPGVTVLPAKAEGLDLAFLWVPQPDSVTGSLPVAATSVVGSDPQAKGQWTFPIVRSSGFPVSEGRQVSPPSYRELTGLLLPLLSQPLEGGMQLATTAAVRKGMSGGGLFNEQGALIGLNTTHADPLWSAPLREEDGKAVTAELNRKLELVALAIPVSRIMPLLEKLNAPVAASQPSSVFRGPGQGGGKPGQQAGREAAMAAICNGYLW